jgi:outer membrane receptor protein involved in Fe transport
MEEQIVVTGSRIRRKDLTTPAPVTVISRQQFESSGKMTIGDFLQTLPEQGNAPNFQVNTGGINYGTDSTTRINLRSLGTQRTLVLINGRRVVPSGLGASSSVDLNTIPTEAIDRIEVLKDGASAVYGSDAIAGVVNVITRRNYNGTDVGAQYGLSGHGDAASLDAHITTGRSDENAGAIFSVRYFKQGDSWLRDRPWASQALDYDYTPGGGGFSFGSSRTPQGTLRIPEDPNNLGHGLCGTNALCIAMSSIPGWKPSTRFIRDPSGPFCTPDKSNCFRKFISSGSPNDFYNFAAENYLTTPSTTIQAFSSGDAKWSAVRGYYEVSYTQRSASQNAAPMPLNPADYADIQVSKDSIYNPFGADLNYLGRRLVEFGRRTYSEELGTFRVVTGLDGTLPALAGPLQGWFWDASLNYGRTAGTFSTGGSFRNSRVKNAVGPSAIVNGKPVCLTKAGDLTSVIDGCTPLNLLGGPGSIDPSQRTYLGYVGTSRAFDEMFTVGAHFGGELFTLAADRPVSLAAGYEFRRQSGSQIADPVAQERDSADFEFASTSGHFYTNEVYAELLVPLLSNMPGVEALEASAALRYVNYNTFGGNTSYEFGARYTPVRDFTVRGTYQTTFRAPSISELYLGGFELDPAATDPCADLTALPGGLTGSIAQKCRDTGVKGTGSADTGSQEVDRNSGNPNLKAETAKSYTLGVVVTPQMVRGLSVTADYFHIAIEDAISTSGAPYILQGCYSANPYQPFCDAIVRSKFGTIQYINDFFTNFGERSTAGIDFAIKYALPTPVGRFAFAFEGNWLAFFDSRLKVAGFPTVSGKGNFDLGALPAFKSNIGAEWAMANVNAGAVGRYVSSFDECSNSSDPTTSAGGLCNLSDGTANPYRRRVSSYLQVDVHAGYRVASTLGKTSFFVGINNLFDKAPPYIYGAPLANSDPTTYDFLGRYVYGRVTHAF